MFSEKIPYAENHKQTSVYINGYDLATIKVSMRERDLLMTGLENYLLMKDNGNIDVVQTRVESHYSFLTNSFLYPLVKHKIYNHPCDVARFEAWFRQKCSRLLNTPVSTVEVIERHYQFNPKQSSATLIKTEQIAIF